jgi:uridine kinase
MSITIGIGGGSGSGKSTLVEMLLAAVGEVVVHLPHDAYYRNCAEMPEHIRSTENWDHPDALDTELFLEHLRELQGGREIRKPEYDFGTHSRKPVAISLEPRPVILVEGILVLAIPEIRACLDLNVFVEAPADIRLLRRFLRDSAERGRDLPSIAAQYLHTVREMHARFVEPSKSHAHLVVPWERHNDHAVEVLVNHICAAAGCLINTLEERQ